CTPWALLLTVAALGCGDDGTGPPVDETGATLQGRIVQFEPVAGLALPGPSAAPVNDVSVAVGTLSTTTDGNGNFVLTDLPLGDRTIVFAGSASYALSGIEADALFELWGIQVNGPAVKTEHTGTWVGTAGSSDPGSAGQIAFTLTIAANGNALSGTGTLAPPDASVWNMTGTENGRTVTGVMKLVSSNSSCAGDASFTGSFSGNTLAGTFVELAPPAGCGSPESGTFQVVKQ
ncbi:MAG: hypothetical protein KJO11_02465, partial [Gemmatimonadetes bacterium]|nr:hypothetical protein [Gemmatimonadota bacterium]